MQNASEFAYLLDKAGSAIDAGESDDVLRLIDRARRIGPDSVLVRRIHAKALVSAGHFNRAIVNLSDQSEPNLKLIRIEALFRLGEIDRASELCGELLSAYATDAIDGLATLASQIFKAPTSKFPGWIGIDSTMRLIGEVRSSSPPIASSGAERFHCFRLGAAQSDCTEFEVSVPGGFKGGVDVHADGLPLLGSGLAWPPRFDASGWVALEGREICGEIHFGWAPGLVMTLLVECGGRTLRSNLQASDSGEVGTPFSIPLAWTCSDTETITCALALPDGSRRMLSGSPFSRFAPVTPTGWTERLTRPTEFRSYAEASDRPVDIVIPIYAGYEETLACLDHVFASTTPAEAEIVVIDDASPDAALIRAVRSLAGEGRITLLTNRSNLGFPGAANRGLALHPDRDVVILNADTEVFNDWLARLKRAAYAAADIATVTPFGNAASIVSYPGLGERACTREEAQLFDGLARSVNAGLGGELPVGIGFCLYVRRACLDEVGPFDEAAFGRGYGEENDLCLRARRHGWRHVLAADVFVRHLGGRSFAAEKAVLMARNRRVLVGRHPEFETEVENFQNTDPLRHLRRAIDAERLIRTAQRPVVILTSALTGGVARFLETRQAELVGLGHTVITVRPADFRLDNDEVIIKASSGDFESLAFKIAHEIPQLESILQRLEPFTLEWHHFLGHSFSSLDNITRLATSFEIYIHDYSWICPRLTLLGGGGGYCGEPPINDCEACIEEHGSMLQETISVVALRERSGRLLAAAKQIIAPSEDTRRRLRHYFPGLRISARPWETPLPTAHPWGHSPRTGRRRIAILGALSFQKGYRVLLACAQDAEARDLPLEFVVIGYSRDDAALFATGRVFVTGQYKEEELEELLDRESCDAFFFASVTPETWCYTLTPTLSMGRPIVAFDIGAIAERLKLSGVGNLIPLETSIDDINSTLLRVTQDSLGDLPCSTGHDAVMTPETDQPREDREKDLSASAQTLRLPAGIFAFRVTTASAESEEGDVAAPAVHVGIAPGGRSGALKILAGSIHKAGWLSRPGDSIVVEIGEEGACLLLMSLSLPDGPPLSIDVHQVEADGPTVDGQLTDDPVVAGDVTPMRILAHVHKQGDVAFLDGGWAGCLGQQQWIEAFSLMPDDRFNPDFVEYRAIGLHGAETPWIGDGQICGSRGSHEPLIAFAIRLKDVDAGFDCYYRGRFLSGAVVGPLRGGDICRSPDDEDPLEGLVVWVSERDPGTTTGGPDVTTAFAQ